METINKEKITTKLEQAKIRAKRQIHRAKVWAEQNPELALAGVGLGVAGIQYFGKMAIKDIRTNREIKLQKCSVYDHSAGHRWTLRRELTTEEWLMVGRRREAGEKLADILEEMRVLK